jgi:glycosyltransferase involved in cell wall biosynthesis
MNTKIRIVIDLQGAQIGDQFWKIKFYVLHLIEAFIRSNSNYEIHLVLNGNYQASIDSIRNRLSAYVLPTHIHIFYPINSDNLKNHEKKDLSEQLYKAFIQNLNPYILLLTSLFHSYEECGIIVQLDDINTYKVFAVISDFESHQFQNNALENHNHLEFYLKHFKKLQNCDFFFAPSTAAKRNTINILKVEDQKFCTINTVNSDFFIKNIQEKTSPNEGFESVGTDNKGNAESYPWQNIAYEMLDFINEKSKQSSSLQFDQKKKLAYVSPLPPEKTGIADYSAELIPALEKHYDIDLIVEQNQVVDERLNDKFNIYGPQYLKENYQKYDRILYHVGNSPFHIYIFDLLKIIPGVVVLHDFYLSNVEKYLAHVVFRNQYFQQSLYNNHGYKALSYFSLKGEDPAVLEYPCSLFIFDQALGIIFHSEFSKKLARDWYGYHCKNEPIPLLRSKCAHDFDRQKIKESLGFNADAFIITSFGFLGETKLNAVLLDAFLDSVMINETNCHLIFVGGYNGEYALNMLEKVKKNKMTHRVIFTNWTNVETYQNYLKISDVSVQLRSSSRGESSAAVLDCMNYGVPTIINANGSMAEIPNDVVIKIPDHFSTKDLRETIESLYFNTIVRQEIGIKGSSYIEEIRSPDRCAGQYFDQIETFYRQKKHPLQILDDVIKGIETEKEILECISAINKTLFKTSTVKTFFVDISVLVKQDLKTGMERVTRGLLTELLRNPPYGYRVEPVYATSEDTYRYARKYTAQFLNLINLDLDDEFIDYNEGDIFFLLDWAVETTIRHQDYLFALKNHGVKIVGFICDILPINRAEFFPKDMAYFAKWVDVLLRTSHQIICISETVAKDVKIYIEKKLSKDILFIKVDAINLGADIENSDPTKGLPNNAEEILSKLKKKISFLIVGTVEPRKGHMQVIEAFSSLWNEGYDYNLVIVGKVGWDKTIQASRVISGHPELNKRLFWLEGISDEYLSEIYSASTCLIAASEAEGYGLPIIEAAKHGLPVIARNISVFQEVSQGCVYFFEDSKNTLILRESILEWVKLFKENLHPRAEDIKTITWAESAGELTKKLIGN